MKKSIVLVFFGILTVSGSMFGSLSETFSHTTAGQAIPFTENFSLPGFNSALGDLTGVTIMLTDDTTPFLSVVNLTGTTQHFTNGTVSIPFTVMTAGLTTTVVATGTVAAATASGFMNDYDVATYHGSVSTDVLPADLSFFERGGNLPFVAYTGAGSYGGTSGPSVFFGGGGSTGGTTSLIYTYTADVVPVLTPEPVFSGVVGFALISLFAIKRKFLPTN